MDGVDAGFLEARLRESMQTRHQKDKVFGLRKGFSRFWSKKKENRNKKKLKLTSRLTSTLIL